MLISKNNIDSIFKCKKSSVETMKLKGYKLIKKLFVDNSGLGQPNEPAYTSNGFIIEVKKLISEYSNLTAKITNEGQFQVYVGLFQKIGKSKMQKVDNNTYKIDTDTGYKIRLHDTDIIEYNDNKIILNSGGYQTKTTRDRINKYLPAEYHLSQKNFEWFILDKGNGKITPFIDNIILNR